ncbi:MAG: hypothetical protein JRJ45_07865 [Deltaproteobacteria bacterium]|nr:hypothetical protein [Deltaproteobacteria bacterium]
MNNENPYFIDEPSAISFSGGRTSAYMLFKVMEAHGGKLPDYLKVTFANTGKEMPETLDFVRDCGEKWNVDIVWLECSTRLGTEDESKKYYYETKVVDYETANRNGQPFHELIMARRYMPNPVARFCTQELKILRIRDWMNEQFPKEGRSQVWLNVVGLRADEQRRAAKMNGRDDVYLPMVDAGDTKKDVYDFWQNQSFDLKLPNNNGVTDWGNCDLCFLKGLSKKLSIIRKRPDLADWWEEQEQELAGVIGKGAFFRSDQPSYAVMKTITLEQSDMFSDVIDETIPCYCGD